ncbi:MAG: MATE family efflux transporter [Gammaproteobacteria bacterium]|nr:MATE family efflux transporter [Gammaproteobacteria bacterium]
MTAGAGKGPPVRGRLVDGPVSAGVLSMMVPMMMGMVAIVINLLVGAFFVAKVSTEQLAAISFTFPVSFIIGAIAVALGTGMSSVASRLFGSGNRDEVRRITGHAMALAVACAAVVLAIGLATIDPLFTMLGADETTLPFIREYMKIYYWGGLFLVTPMIANSVLRASGDARRPAMITTAAAIINIVVDPILIFGWFGFPRMEIAGAAIGAVIANAVTMLASGYFVIRRQKLVSFRNFQPELLLDSWRRILHVGLPALASSLAAPITTGFITSQVARFGQDAVAGFGMAARLEGLTLMVLMALAAAMTPFTGQNFGAGRLDRVRDGISFSYRFSLFYGAAIALVLFVAGGFITSLFDLTPAARSAALLQMSIVPFSYIALGCSMTVNGALNAMGQPMAAMFVSLSRTIVVYAPLAWILSKLFGLPGIFVAAAAANLVAGGIGARWFRKAFRETQARHEAAVSSQAA